jgi:hypothetical protein
MKTAGRGWVGLWLLMIGAAATADEAAVPRPEHPRPNAVRAHWANLNGAWQFRFDADDAGVAANWNKPDAPGFDRTITVPFPWESELSGIHDTSKTNRIGWYRRAFRVPAGFPNTDRVILRFEAVDWRADVWVNGAKVAEHEGGYSPFEADITDVVKRGDADNTVVVRAFDDTNPSLPTGKQVGWYTTTSGIWQTVWLESRPKARIATFAIETAIDPAAATFAVETDATPAGGHSVVVRIQDGSGEATGLVMNPKIAGPAGERGRARVVVPVKDAKLWSPESPHLYEATVELKQGDQVIDTVRTYFGLRTIGRGKLPGEDFERVLLNGKPVYLRGALDQSFNPKGIHTAPDDEFFRRDMYFAKFAGFNMLRIHIKPEEPRRLYWADKVGVLIMQDMPNTWRQNETARAAWESTMEATILRDRNHPSIFAWVAFNETWGLGSPDEYKANKDTQDWVRKMVARIRKLDPTRLVEDNSPCNYDHLPVTDLNSWHFYIDDSGAANRHVAEVVARTTPGSPFNSCPGEALNSAPLINSEYGAVSAGGGDRDVAWGFKDLTTILRKHNKIQGYIYTELTDIEWEHNGIFNYDRSGKIFGYDEFLPDMWVNELQQPDFIGYDGPPALVVEPGAEVKIPVFVSHYSDKDGPAIVRWWVQGWDDAGNIKMVVGHQTKPAKWEKYQVTWQDTVTFKAPDHAFSGAVVLTLREPANPPGSSADPRIAVNYVNLVVRPKAGPVRARRVTENQARFTFAPEDFARSRWAEPSQAPEGKVYGRGAGLFEYRIQVPEAVVKSKPNAFYLRVEAGSKAGRDKVDWPERVNGQDYPQTDGRAWPSALVVKVNGRAVDRVELEDDAADARGVLSHLKRVEHGSHGEMYEFHGALTDADRAALEAGKPLSITLEVPPDARPAGGLTIFGAETGLYPFDPTLEIITEKAMPESLGIDPMAPVAVEKAVARRVTVLPTGESGQGAEWSYTTADPGPGWEKTEFDAGNWKKGQAGFGTDGTPAVRVNTTWNAPRIWLRTTVTLPEVAASDLLALRFFHDEDMEVFVNGKRLLREGRYLTAYRDVALTTEQRSLFQPGPNTIAVSCRQREGGQGIDVGLHVIRMETSESEEGVK